MAKFHLFDWEIAMSPAEFHWKVGEAVLGGGLDMQGRYAPCRAGWQGLNTMFRPCRLCSWTEDVLLVNSFNMPEIRTNWCFREQNCWVRRVGICKSMHILCLRAFPSLWSPCCEVPIFTAVGVFDGWIV